MTQEVLKLALEALYPIAHNTTDDSRGQAYKAITAIKEALAQPERDYERGFIDGMQKQMQSSVDKAVNRMAQTQERPVDCERCNRLEEHAYDLIGKLRVANIKLSMQPRRTWVGLTDEEITGLHHEIKVRLMGTYKTEDIYRAIEARLKEKNNA